MGRDGLSGSKLKHAEEFEELLLFFVELNLSSHQLFFSFIYL